jgi:O-antigen/teichoic acid export membrane protein
MACLGLLAAPIIRLALGPRWLGAAPLVTCLALAYIAPLFAAPFPPLAMALGRTDRLFRRNLLEAAIRLPTVAAGAWLWGASGVAAAQALAVVVISLNIMGVAGRMIGASIGSQLGAAWRALVAGALTMGVLLALRPLTDGAEGARLLAALALCGFGALGAYAAGLLALWLAAGRPEGIETTLMRAVALGARRLRAAVVPAHADTIGPADQIAPTSEAAHSA